MTKLFPYLLVRTGGDSVDKLYPLLPDDVRRSTAQVKQCAALAAVQREEISGLLFARIQEETDDDVRRTLINLRRDLYNYRTEDAHSVMVQQYLPAGLAAQVELYLQRVRDWKEALAAHEQVYKKAVAAAMDYLRSMAGSGGAVMGGIVLSSDVLFGQLQSYAAKGRRGDKFDNMELSLVKYLTRTVTKTSPFSTFGGVVADKLCQAGEAAPAASGALQQHIRINNNVFKHILYLLLADSGLTMNMRICLNPTVKRAGEDWVFITSVESTEAFQRIGHSPVLGLIAALAGETMTLKDLLAELEQSIDASRESLHDYVLKLVGYGFLEFDTGISGLDPDWDLKLIAYLSSTHAHAPASMPLCALLGQLRERAAIFAGEAPAARHQLLQDIFALLRDWSEKMHGRLNIPFRHLVKKIPVPLPGKEADRPSAPAAVETAAAPRVFEHHQNTTFLFKPENILYEDSVRDARAALREERLAPFVSNLNYLVQCLRMYDVFLADKRKMMAFYASEYGSVPTVPLLDFYESYARYTREPETPAETERLQAEGKLYGFQHAGHAEQWYAFMNKLLAAYEVGRDLALDAAAFESAGIRPGLLPAQHAETSYCAFVQFLHGDDDASGPYSGAVNIVAPGYGKYFSRFFHLAPPDMLETQRSWNAAHAPDEIMIENTDASYFNANIHPPLMPYEMKTPKSNSSLRKENHVSVADILVAYDQPRRQLQLRHKLTGRRVNTFDLSFQTLQGRSPLFQFLTKFSPAHYPNLPLLLEPLNGHCIEQQKEKAVMVIPRVTFGETVIIQRRGWIIRTASLPVRQPAEGAGAFMIRTVQWLEQYAVPSRFFMKAFRHKNISTLRHQGQQNRDDNKPQYLDMESPVLFALFCKAVSKAADYLFVEELLPDPVGQTFVKECVIQWNNINKQ